jgi:hypothetical protein
LLFLLGLIKIHLSKRLVTFDLDVELAAGHGGDDFSGDDRLDAEIGEGTAEDSTAEDDVLGREFEVLRRVGDLTEEAEGVVLKDVDSLMIRPEVVDLLLENRTPEVGAEELDGVEFVFEPRHFSRESFDESVAGGETDVF